MGVVRPDLLRLAHDRQPFARAAGEVQQVTEVDPGGALLEYEPFSACDLERLTQVLDPAVEVAAAPDGYAEGVEGDGLGLSVAHGLRHRQGLARHSLSLREARLQHRLLRLGPEQTRTLRALLALRQQRERAVEHLDRLVLAMEVPERVAQLEQQGRAPARVVLRHELEGAAQQRLLATRVAGRVGRRRGPHQHVDAAAAGEPLRIRDSLPELERPLEQRLGLGGRVHALGSARGTHGRGERARLIAGSAPVLRHLRRDMGAGLARLDAGLEHPAERGVHRGALTREQVVVDHLAEQRVAEGVAAVLADDGDLGRHRLAQTLAELGAVRLADRLEQSLARAGLAGDPAQQLLCAGREPLDAQHQGVAQSRRQRPAAVEAGGEDLLGEEGVALGARPDALDEPRLRLGGEDPLELLARAPRA